MNDAELYQKIGQLEAHVDQLRDDMAELKAEIKSMTTILTKWKGVSVALLAIGGAAAWIVEKLLGFLK